MRLIVLYGVVVLASFDIVACDHAGLVNARRSKLAAESLASQASEAMKMRGSQLIELLGKTAANFTPNACGTAIQSWIKSLEKGELWALRMIDAAGKLPPSGLLIGNAFALGSYWECVNTSESAGNNNSSHTPVRGQYCTATLGMINSTGINAMLFKLKVGLCLPDACNATDTYNLVTRILRVADAIPYVGSFLSEIGVSDATCELNNVPLGALAVSGICLVAVFALLVIAGTSYDTLFEYSHGRIVEATAVFFRQFAVSPCRGANVGDVIEDDRERLVVGNVDESSNNGGESHAVTVNSVEQPREQVRKGFLGRLFSVFSLRSNGAAIFSTKSTSDQLDCLHGLRFISMVWIITGHTYGGAVVSPADALLTLEHYMQSWTFQVMWNATFSVDTFFIISGLLTTYVTMRYISRVGSAMKFKWHLFYLHRYLRLTPVYGIAIFLYVAILPNLSSGPQAVQTVDQQCVDNWWTNMLYISNFYNANEACFGHGWYLANDMQFFIISPLVIIPLWIAPVAGICVIFLLVAVSIISTAVITAVNNFSANPLDMSADQQQTDSLGPIALGIDVYIKPYCRVGSYAIGMFVGYLLFRTKRKLRMNPWTVVFGWAVSTALAITVLWCLYDAIRGATVLTTAQSAAYLSLSRIAWSISIGWVILACTTGYGGWVNSLLSWKVFAPLGRLTYCAYLLHPLLIPLIFAYMETAVDLREFPMYYYAAGNVVMAYAAAVGFNLLFESPFLGLEKLVFGRE